MSAGLQRYRMIICRCVLFLGLVIGLGACTEGVEVTDPMDTTSSGNEAIPQPGTPGNSTDPDVTEPQLQPPATGESALAVHDGGFEGPYYSGSGQCSTCHDGMVDPAGNDVSIVRDWSTSMMANAARDPYWIAKVAAEMEREPVLKDELDDTCSRCHTPMANDTARKDNTPIAILGADGFLSKQNPLFDHAMEGVSCTLCHQVEDDGLLGSVEGTTGNFSVAIAQRRSDRPAYGPYVDPNGVRMQTQAEFKPLYGPHIATSESCAACHDLRTPEFTSSTSGGAAAASFFPEQMVYSEWKNSAYARSDGNARNCQSCHMPVVEGAVRLATTGGGRAREGFSRHTFLGPNTVMQSVLMNNLDELGIGVPRVEFENSIARNREFIKSSASVQIVSTDNQNGELLARVRVQNLAGHKLPSGFASRRAYIHFVVTDRNGAVVFESGRANADGSVNGIATDINSEEYEQHYELITSAEQVQVYEAIMGDEAMQVTHTLMNASSYLKDNRLLPAGFDKTSAPDDIKTTGLASADIDFDAGGDEIVYRVAIPEGVELTVSATLLYQPLAYGHLQDLFKSAQVPSVSYFKALFETANLKSEIIAAQSVRVPAN